MAGTALPTQAPPGWVLGVNRELKGFSSPSITLRAPLGQTRLSSSHGRGWHCGRAGRGHSRGAGGQVWCSGMSSIHHFSPVPLDIQAFPTPGKAGAGSVNVKWRWERRRWLHGEAAVWPHPCSFPLPVVPPGSELLEEDVNRFGEVVHVRVGLHMGVVLITGPAEDTEGQS